MRYIVHLTRNRTLRVDGYRSSPEEGGVLMVSTASGNVLVNAREWLLCIPEDVEIEWEEPPEPSPDRIGVGSDPERPFRIPFGVIDRGEAIDAKLREIDD